MVQVFRPVENVSHRVLDGGSLCSIEPFRCLNDWRFGTGLLSNPDVVCNKHIVVDIRRREPIPVTEIRRAPLAIVLSHNAKPKRMGEFGEESLKVFARADKFIRRIEVSCPAWTIGASIFRNDSMSLASAAARSLALNSANVGSRWDSSIGRIFVEGCWEELAARMTSRVINVRNIGASLR